jgi:hypothetical protein
LGSNPGDFILREPPCSSICPGTACFCYPDGGRARLRAVSTKPGSTPLRLAALLLLALFFAGHGAAAAADAHGEGRHPSAWVRAGARSLSVRPLALPGCDSPALASSPLEVTPAGAVIRVPPAAAARSCAAASASPRAALPRGPPLPA